MVAVDVDAIVKSFQNQVYGQSKWEPLSSAMMYIIHTKDYDKPYPERVKQRIDRNKLHILNMIETGELNESNVFDRNVINEKVFVITGNRDSQIDEHEYMIAFCELIRENESVMELVSSCC